MAVRAIFVFLGSASSRFEDDNGPEQLSEGDGGYNGGYTGKNAVAQSLPVVTLWHMRQKNWTFSRCS